MVEVLGLARLGGALPLDLGHDDLVGGEGRLSRSEEAVHLLLRKRQGSVSWRNERRMVGEGEKAYEGDVHGLGEEEEDVGDGKGCEEGR